MQLPPPISVTNTDGSRKNSSTNRIGPTGVGTALQDSLNLAVSIARRREQFTGIIGKDAFTDDEIASTTKLMELMHISNALPTTGSPLLQPTPSSVTTPAIAVVATHSAFTLTPRNGLPNTDAIQSRTRMSREERISLYKAAADQLLEVTVDISTTDITNIDELCGVLCLDTNWLLGATTTHLWQYDAGTRQFQCTHDGQNDSLVAARPGNRKSSSVLLGVHIGKTVACDAISTSCVARAASTGRAYIWDSKNLQEDDKSIIEDIGNSNVAVGVPLVVDGNIFGVLQCLYNANDTFHKEHVQFVEAFSIFAAVALRNAQNYIESKALQQRAEVMLNLAEQLSHDNLDEKV
eukprot:PhM_4_TR18661/c2_g2_i1/m.19897